MTFDLQPTGTNVSNGSSYPQGEQLHITILTFVQKWKSCGRDISGQLHTQHTHLHRTEIVAAKSHSPQGGSTKRLFNAREGSDYYRLKFLTMYIKAQSPWSNMLALLLFFLSHLRQVDRHAL